MRVVQGMWEYLRQGLLHKTPRLHPAPHPPNSSITHQPHLPEVAKLLRIGVVTYKMMVLEAVVTLQRTEGTKEDKSQWTDCSMSVPQSLNQSRNQ